MKRSDCIFYGMAGICGSILHLIAELIAYYPYQEYIFSINVSSEIKTPYEIIVVGVGLASLGTLLGLFSTYLFRLIICRENRITRNVFMSSIIVYVVVLLLYNNSIGFVRLGYSALDTAANSNSFYTMRNILSNHFEGLFSGIEIALLLVTVVACFIMMESIYKGKTFLPNWMFILVPFGSFLNTKFCSDIIRATDGSLRIGAIVFDNLCVVAMIYVIMTYALKYTDPVTDRISRKSLLSKSAGLKEASFVVRHEKAPIIRGF